MQYPYDIFTLRRSQTFSVEGRFVQKTDDSPMKVFDNTFSRYVFTVIGDGSAQYFNVHIEDLPGIIAKTNIAASLAFTPKPAASGQKSPAFTERFRIGPLKGKTPIDVLLENPEKGKAVLNEQYQFLQANLGKYKDNQILMDAIVDASKQDLTKCQGGSPAMPVKILDITCRPLVRKKRSDGMSFCYEGDVTYDPSMRYPVTVSVKNYYAPVRTMDNGTLNVDLSNKDRSSEKTKEFHMTMEEWLAAVDAMEQTRKEFRQAHFMNAWKMAEDAAKAARESARRSA